MIIYDPKIAILLIAFNRSNIKQVFDRIKVVKPRRLYIAVDESTNDTQCKICKETTSIVSHIDWECQVFKLYQEKNQGYDKHCFHSISWFFEQEPEGIILEDDCVPSLSFFGYCTTLLKKFRNDERIGHISGSNYQFGKNRGDGTYYYSNLTHVSGWAGWRRVWQEHCLNENKYDLFNQLDYLSNLPSHAPFQYRWNRLFNIVNHSNEHFWEVKYAYTNLINNRLSIIPNKNLITKIAYYDKMPHAIKNHPFTNIKNEEIDHIVHPSFICPDIEADLYSQTKEYNTSFEELYMPKEYFYLKEHFVAAIRNNHIHPKIPQIIHQIYEDLAGPPPSLVEISQSWKELNPDWEYRFWNKNDIETFLKTYYPEFIPAYNAFPHNVQRWDAIRYLILYKFGGLYVDMDYECTENITPILCNTECAMGLEPEAHAVRIHVPYIVGNAFMATVPEHPYFKELIDAVFCTEKNSNMYSDLCELILNTTGPCMTTQVYKNSNYQKRVTLIPAELITPLTHTDIKRIINTETTKNVESKIEKSFAIHYFFGSWHK